MGKWMYMIKSWMETRKKEKMESKQCLHKYPSNRLFRYGIHSLLMRADSRGSADIIYRMRRITLLCRSGISLLTSQSRSRTEYLIPTNSIIVFAWYFNLTKRNLISLAGFNYDSIRFFDNLTVAYFLGHPAVVVMERQWPSVICPQS